MIDAIAGWMQHLFEVLGAAKELSPLVYLLVALGGVASAISPCYVPVLAMFGGYVSGYAKEKKTGGLSLALPFVLGNAITLAIVGGVASLIGGTVLQIFTGYQLDRWIPGILGLLMGLQLLGVLRLKMPVMPIFRWTREQPGKAWSAFALGLPFGLVVTPCTIPIFFAIVAYVALQGNVLHGALLMVAYALGRGAILTAVAGSVGALKAFNMVRSFPYLERASGLLILLISIGLLLFYDGFVEYTMQLMAMGMMQG